MGGMLNVGALAMDQGEWELLASYRSFWPVWGAGDGLQGRLTALDQLFHFFSVPSQTLTLLAMSTNSRSTW